MRYDLARWAVGFVLLMPVLATRADELITGAPGEGVVIGNPPGDWHSPASARHELDRFAGGCDADEAGDRFGYRLFGGSRFERDDNALILPIMIEGHAIDLTVETLAAGAEAKPLAVTLNGRAVGQVPLGGRNNEHVTATVRFECDAGYGLLRLVVSEPGRPVFIDAVRMIGARLAGPERTFAAGGMRWTLPRSVSTDDTFRLWTFGRYLKGCTERRSHDYEVFRVKRKRINRGGYRQVDAAHDTWHNLFRIKRDADGRQVENWAEMGRRWYIGSADTSTSDQTRGFQIAFDSPVAGTGRLVLHATPDAPPTSLVMVVNGDRQRARIGIGQPGIAGPSGWEVDPHVDVEGKKDLQPGRATVYQRIAVRAGHNTIDLDYAGFAFLWPAKTFPGLAELVDLITFDLTPAVPLPSGAEVPFREPAPAGERYEDPAQVTVDLDVRWTRRGVSAIPPRLFGVTTYSVGRSLTTAEKWAPLKHINVGGVNGGLHWGAGWPTEDDGHVADVEEYWRQQEQRIKGRPEVQVLAAAREAGIDVQVNISTSGWAVNPLWHSGGVPTDVAAWSGRIHRLAGILAKLAPWAQYIYFYHENDALLQHSHLLHDFDAEKFPASYYQGMTCAAAMRKIRRDHPHLKMIGPTNYGTPFGGMDGRDYVGNRFEDWVRPYLEATWDELDAFSTHSYWLAYTREQAGEYQTLINYMRLRFGEEKPVFMDEGGPSGGDWSAWTKWDDRALWLYHGFSVLRTLMNAVHTMDKRQAIFWHDYANMPQHEWSTIRPVPAGLPAPSRPHLMNDSPTPIWTGLWLFRQLRGETLRVEAGPGAEAVAAFDGDAYSIVVVNHALVDRDLTVALRLPPDRTIATVRVECNEPGTDFYRFDAGTLPADRWHLDGTDLTIRARPLAGYHVRIALDESHAPSHVAGVEESFGDRVMVEVNRNRPRGGITIDCDPRVRKRARRAFLRIAQASLLMEPEEIAFVFNGHPVDVNRRDFIEIPLALSSVRERNRLTFEMRDPENRNWFRIRSATIVTEFAPRKVGQGN